MKKIAILFLFVLLIGIGNAEIKLFNQNLGNMQVNETEFQDIVNYDLWISAPKLADDLPGTYSNTWERAKALNPNIKILLYKHGTYTVAIDDSNERCFRSTADRFNLINNNYPHLVMSGFESYTFIDWGYGEDSSETLTKWYEILWQAIQEDTLSLSCSDFADGIYLDQVSSAYEFTGNKWPKYTEDNCVSSPTFDCPDTELSWGHHMWWFAGNIVKLIHDSGEIAAINAGMITTKQYNSFMAYENDSSKYLDKPEYAQNEFGPFGHSYTGCNCDFQWFVESYWKHSIDNLKLTNNIGVLYQATLRTPTIGGEMIDQYGNSYDYYDMLWFAITSFMLGDSGNDFFGTDTLPGDSYGEANWWPEYDSMRSPNGNLNFGNFIGTYTEASGSYDGLYWREYENGYVIVNPTNSNKNSVNLNSLFGTDGKEFKKLNHNNFQNSLNTIPNITSTNIQNYSGILLRKTTTSPCNIHEADTDSDCKISEIELNSYISSWKTNSHISLFDLMEAISLWKNKHQ